MMDEQLAKLQALHKRVARLRFMMGDMTSPPQLIIKKKGARRALFKTRQEQLRRLEIQRDNLLSAISRELQSPPSDT
jgi:hypothetical protein